MIKKILLIAILSVSLISFSQTIEDSRESLHIEKAMPLAKGAAPGSFNLRHTQSVRGNMVSIGNSNLNRDLQKTREFYQNKYPGHDIRFRSIKDSSLNTGTDNANVPYVDDLRVIVESPTGVIIENRPLANGQFHMEYVNVDPAAGIFSSSKATLDLPICSRVTYAGLYWVGVYPHETWTVRETRSSDFNKIKFKYPSSTTYNDIIADDIIYATNEPYICFKDITADIQAEANPNGTYTAANIRAVRGRIAGPAGLGGSSGWVMVVIYENDTKSSKNISIFDGFTTVNRINSQDIVYSGFQTIPSGPVRIEQIVATLEGDKIVRGDNYQIKDKASNYVNIFNAITPENNFFNSSISAFDAYLTGITPASTNTLGLDINHFKLKNPGNSVIGNNQTSAEVRFTSTGDYYWPFLNAMSIEVIEPKIKLVKKVTDAAGADIAGASIPLGSELFYDLTFSSVGTDNASETVIIDELPKNVDLVTSGLSPASMTLVSTPPPSPNTNTNIVYTYEAPVAANGFRGKLKFYIPDALVKSGGAESSIKFKIKVTDDCNKLRDVCANRIENQAYANYSRDLSFIDPTDPSFPTGYENRIENTPSFSGIDPCNLGMVGSSIFIINTSGCKYEREETLCGGNVDLEAGDGFTTYSWVNQANPSVVLSTNKIYTATATGTYVVTKTTTTGCGNSTETIKVIPYKNEPNPIIPFADQVFPTCNGFELSEIYLCGAGASKEIKLPFTGATRTTVKWFKLDETIACSTTTSDCANIDTACTWNEIGTTFDRTFTQRGQYKVEVKYDGQCPTTYYFNIFTASLTPRIVEEHIICGADGSITVNDVPAGYEYALTGPAGYNAPFQDANSFTGLTAPGDYDLVIRLKGSTIAACTFAQPKINIKEQELDLTVDPRIEMLCGGGTATITALVNGDAPGPYTYTLTKDATRAVIGSPVVTNTKGHSFEVSSGGFYSINVTTAKCNQTVRTNVFEPRRLRVTAVKTKDITCLGASSPGIITLTGEGGTIDTSSGETYSYAVWSKDGTPLYTDVASIPATAYSSTDPLFITNETYSVPNGDEGEYVFVITDSRGCFSFSNPIDIIIEAPLTFTHTETPANCRTGGVTDVNVVDDLGYSIEYSIDNTNWFSSGVFNGLSVTTPSTLYTVYIRATKGATTCLYEVPNIEIEGTAPIFGEASLTQDYTCLQSGTITFDTTKTTGGTPPYTYGIDGTFTSDPVKTGLSNLDYALAIRDRNGCEFILPNIKVDDLPTRPTLSYSTDLNCDRTATVTITPFDASYTYILPGRAPQTGDNIFYNVPDGTSTFTVDYGKSCTTDIEVRFTGSQFEANLISSNDSECAGSDNGTITISAKNFYGGRYEYSVDNGVTWNETADNPYRIVGLKKGTYNLQAREVTGTAPHQVICPVYLGMVKIEEPPLLKLTSASVTTEATCTTDATVTVVAEGGVPPYKFSIDGGTTWQDSVGDQYVYTNVAPSTTNYTVLLLDSRRCDQCGCTTNSFQNGSFEQHSRSALTTPGFLQDDESLVPGWDTTDPIDNKIEIWYNRNGGVPAYEGTSFAELNAEEVGALYQEFCTKPGDVITWSLAHRGRSGVDVATVKIGGSLATAPIVETMTDDNSAWGTYSSGTTPYVVPAGQTTTVIAFEALSSTGGPSFGNFIDDVKIEISRVVCTPVEVEVKRAKDVIHTSTVSNKCSTPEIVVNVTDGNGDYQFTIDNGATWNTPTPANATTFTFNNTNGLTAVTTTPQTYKVRVKDGSRCISPETSHIIYPQLTASVITTDESCNPGDLTITPAGGDGDYVYAVVATGTAPTGFSPTNPTTITAGTWDIYVRDNDGVGTLGTDFCESITTRTIVRIADPTITTTATQPNCFGETGKIDVVVANGTAPYTVTVTGSVSGAIPEVKTGSLLNYEFAGLADDTYTITIRDNNGCIQTPAPTEVISVPTQLTGGSATAVDLMCDASGGTVLGGINFTNPTGGTAGYTFYYKNAGAPVTDYTVVSGNSVAGLPAGSYDTRALDANNCEISLNLVIIDDLPTAPTLASAETYNCDGTGNITITPLDTSYTYTLDGDPTKANSTGVFNNVAVGSAHVVSVAYGSSCTTDITITLDTDKAFGATVINTENPKCGASTGTVFSTGSSGDGSITIKAVNATLPYQYSIDNGITWSDATTDIFKIPNLDEGTYDIRVRQNTTAPFCDVAVSTETLKGGSPPIITYQKELKRSHCDPITGASVGMTLEFGISGGVPPYTVTADYEGISVTETTSSSTVVFTDVKGGSTVPLDIYITDNNGCDGFYYSALPYHSGVEFTLTPEPCYDGTNGTVEVVITGGYENFELNIDGGGWQSLTPTRSPTRFPHPSDPLEYIITGLSDTPSPHTISVRDKSMCVVTKTVTINPELSAFATPTNISCNPGQIVITPSGGDANYLYTITPSAGTSISGNIITVTTAATYTITVQDKAGGTNACSITLPAISIGRVSDVEITLTPNNPTCTSNGGVNGVITTGTGEIQHTITLKDSSGTIIDTLNNYTLDNFNFNNIPSGTNYEVEITDNLGCTDTKTFDLVDPPALVATIDPILPPCGTPFVGNENLFGFEFTGVTTVSAPYTIEFSKDNGATWSTSPEFRRIDQGTTVYPAIRLLESGIVKCMKPLDPYEIPFKVSGLIVNPVSSPAGCTAGFSVTVEALNGAGPFEFAINSASGPWQPADPLTIIDPTTGMTIDPTRTRTYNGLIQGESYRFYVRDMATGCIERNNEDIYKTFTPSVSVVGTVNNKTCQGVANGSITYSITNTSGDLATNFTWTLFKRDDATGTAITRYENISQTGFADIRVDGLDSGSYFVRLTGGCTFASLDSEIEEAPAISGDLRKINDITCSLNGRVLIENVIGGVPATTSPNYTYNVINVTNTTSAPVVNATDASVEVSYASVTDKTLPVTFEIEVIDANAPPNACTQNLGMVTFAVSQAPTINSVTVNSCSATNSITINTTGGIAPYSYSFDGINFESPVSTATHIINGVVDGVSQTLTVRDTNGCTDTFNFTVYPDITFDITNITIPDCVPADNATATITVNTGSGSGNYEYSLDGATPAVAITGTTVTLPTSLSAGSHTIEIFDTLNPICSLSRTFTVSNTIIPSFDVNITKNNICNGAADGEITITPVANGAGTLSFTIRNITAGTSATPVSGLVIGTLSPGEYEIVGTGTNGCVFTPASLTIVELPPFVLTTPAVTQFECDLGTNIENIATITLPNSGTDLITGGTGTYTRVVFTYTPAAGSPETQDSNSLTFTTTNTSGGNVGIQVFDDSGCSSAVINETINQYIKIDDINISVADAITCNRGERITANATFLPTTATPVVEYQLLDSSGTPVEPVRADGNFVTNLATGVYTVRVFNPTTKCSITKTHTVGDAPVYDFIAYNPVNETCKAADDGQITVNFSTTSATYTGTYDYQLYDSSGTAIGTPVTVTGEKTITSLAAGTYYIEATLTATSTTGTACTTRTANFTIDESAVALSITAAVTKEVTCRDDLDATITATAADGWGGYTYQLENTSGIVTGFDFATNGNNNVFTGLPSGDYTVRVLDSGGCQAISRVVPVANPSVVTFTVTEDDTSCDLSKGGEITVTGLGGSGTYTYTLTDDTTPTPIVRVKTGITTAHTFTNLPEANYTVTVTDSNLCVGTVTGSSSIVTISEGLVIEVNETKKLDCSPTPNANVELNVLSGSGIYEYQITGPSAGVTRTTLTGTSLTFNPTVAGDYEVTVFDTGATPVCSKMIEVKIAPKLEPIFTALAIVDNLCNGDANGIIQVSETDNGINPLTYSISPVTGTYNSTAKQFEGLTAGNYVITAIGTNGCPATNNVEISEKSIIDIDPAITVKQFDCVVDNNINLATITIDKTVIVGGIVNPTDVPSFDKAIFVYDNGTPADTSDDIKQEGSSFKYTVPNELGGIVTITVFDDAGCSDTETRTIAPFERLTSANITVTKEIDCSTGENITVKSTTDIAGLVYTITGTMTAVTYPPQTVALATGVATFNNLPIDNYTITIQNPRTGCVFSTTHTVTSVPTFNLNISNIKNVSCLGTASGSAELIFGAAEVYNGNYTYEIFNVGGVTTGITDVGVGNVSESLIGLSAGNYYVDVDMTDSPFCNVLSADFEIKPSPGVLGVTTALSYISCVDPNSGEVELQGTSGWGSYTYQLVNTTTGDVKQAYSPNRLITGLDAGNYEVTVKDLNDCTHTQSFTLESPTVLVADVTRTVNQCKGESTATITVTNVTGGQVQDTSTKNYTYTLTYVSSGVEVSQSSNVFKDLSEGSYTIRVVHNKYSCATDGTDPRYSVTITDPTKVVASTNIIADITCNTATATVEVSASGGTGPYTYSNDGVTFTSVNTFSVPSGEQSFYVKDDKGCISDAATATISAYTPLEVTLNVISGVITCRNDSNGVLSADAIGGFGTYEYQLTDELGTPVSGFTWQASNTFSGLNIGTYKIRVRSINRFGVVCTAITVGEHEIKQPTELKGTAVVTKNVSCSGGSTGIITALGTGGNGDYEYNLVSVPASSAFTDSKFEDNGVFENLAAGTYLVRIRDVKGCTISAPIKVEITEPKPLEISLVTVVEQVCLNDATPTITVNVKGGKMPYYISINGLESSVPYNTNTITLGSSESIKQGTTYVIGVRDTNNCDAGDLSPITTGVPIDLKLTVDFSYTCPKGNIIKAFVDDKYKDEVRYTLYDKNDIQLETNTSGEFIDIAAADGYTVKATHIPTSCSESSNDNPENYIPEILDIKELSINVDDSQKNKLTVNAAFGLQSYQYSIDDGDFGKNNEFPILQTKNYKITVRDARGCELTLNVLGTYVSIKVLNIFTPNGDGKNDYWYPLEVEDYHNIKVFIYDRYSRKVQNFQGVTKGWDGTYNGNPLPTGDYWYTIYYNELSGEEKKIMGHFTLYR